MESKKILYQQCAVELNESSHEYTVDGIRKPGVNEMMDTMGLISPWAKRSKAAQRFGTEAHLITQLFLSDMLGDYSEEFEPWMNGIRLFREELKPEPISLEWKGYHDLYDYCGTLDFCGWLHGKPPFLWILDWKFWSSLNESFKSHAKVQIEAYRELVEQRAAEMFRPVFCAIVWFYPDGYEFIPVIDSKYKAVWRSVRTLYHYRNQFNLNSKKEWVK